MADRCGRAFKRRPPYRRGYYRSPVLNEEQLGAARPGEIRTEYLKASIRAKVEHPFRIIKCQFGFVKARYPGLHKQDNKLAMLFTLANIVRVDQMLRGQIRLESANQLPDSEI